MMTSSLHHGNMDHLEHQDEHELQMNLSKELLRSGIAAVESSAIQFIASAPVGSHTREQEYIESSLLGTDLLSSHLPTHTLNDYITSVPCSSSGSLNSLQPTMLEHHYRTFLSDDLQSLVEVSGIHSISDAADRKLFQQYGNKSSTNTLGSSNETAVIVTGSKEIPSFGTITTYDKLLNMAQPPSPIPAGLAQISGAIDGYVHFALPGGETYDLIGNSITTSHHHQEQHDVHNPYGLHHLHHHTQHHHHQQQQPQQQHTQNAKELPVLVNTSIALGQTFIPCSQSSLQPSDASTMKMLSSTIIPVTTTIAEPTNLHDGTTLSISPLRSEAEHSKSYYTSTHLPSFLTNKERSNVALVDAAVLNDIGSEVSDSEARIDEADNDCLTPMDMVSQTMPLAAQESINLPHKKRLSKKIGDTKDTSSSGEPNQSTSVLTETRGTVIATESTVMRDEPAQQPAMLQSAQTQPDESHTTKSTESLSRQEPGTTIVCFSCQLCGQLFQDQLLFFTHLKIHYEPENIGSKKDADAEKTITATNSIDVAESIDASQLEGKKPKPKLPRVKHTKMLKTDRVFKDSTVAVQTQQNYEGENNLTSNGQVQTKPLLSCTQGASISSNGVEIDAGEFSETEDMLEGIRNVVQQTVDKDPTEDSCFNLESKQWFPPSVTENSECISEKGKIVVPSTVEGSSTIQTRDASTNGSASTSSFDMLFNKSQIDTGGLVESSHYQSLQTAPIIELQQPEKCDLLLEPIEAKPLIDSGSKAVATGSSTFLVYASSLIPSMEEQITEPFSKVQEAVSNHTEPSQVTSIRCIPLPNLRNSVEGNDEGSAKHTQLIYTNTTPAADGEKEQNAISMDAPLDDTMEEDSYPDEDNECDSEELDNLSANEHVPALGQTEENVQQSNKAHAKGKRKNRKVQPAGATGNNQAKTSKYLCQVDGCGRQFNSNTAFQYHRLQHTGERPHKCTVCGKCFITCSALKVHERLHSGEKPYKCDQCGHCFRQWGDLKYHNISIHSNEKSHKCEFCGKQFARRYSLSLHRRIHTNEKNFICEYCNKGFRASTYLQTHRRIHTGEKPHQCTICDKKFRCHGDINRHLKTHERIKGKGKQQGQLTADTDDAPKVSQTQEGSNVIDLTKSKPKRAKKATAPKANALE